MRSRTLVTLSALAAAVLVLLPLGGGASAATSLGANGEIAFLSGGNIVFASNPSTTIVTGAVDPSWSPDGTELAFSAGGSIKTCVVSPSCSPGLALATGTEPVWSPDGTKIAFVNGGTNISTIPSGGGASTSVIAGIDPSFDPADATQLAYSSGGQIFTCTVASCVGTSTMVANGTQPSWSPDGTTIAYVNSLGGISATVLGGSTTSVIATGSAPSWSPEGDTLLYADAGGIEVSTQSGSTWTPSPIPSTTGGLTPDRQTLVPVAGAAPTILGSAASGQQLTATNGSWIGADPTHFAYQYTWLRCDSAGNNCNATVGTSSTYAVAAADIGLRLRLVVTGRNAAGSTQSAQSNATAVVTTGALTAPANTAYPVITLPFNNTTGVPNIGDTLSASNGSWTGSFPMTFTYQWKKCDSPTGSCFNIPGQTHSTFTITSDLYGMTVRVQVTATNSSGAVAQNSESTKIITAIAPFLRVTPQITGTVMVGQTLALTPGTWDGSLPLTFTYSWRRCDAFGTLPSCVQIPGATTATYIPVVADIGAAIRVWITATNPAGSDQGVTNHTFPVVDKPHFAPTASDSPLIVGTLEVGGVLTASVGTFAGDAPIVTKQQWQRCDATGGACQDIKGATKQVYHPTSTDVGSTLRLVVTATNLYGKAVSISDDTEPVIPRLPRIKGKTIIGTDKADYLIGTIHDDLIKGLGGNDTINGDGGYDTIYGGPGNDVINVAGPGSSHVYGGPGSDTIYAANGEKDYIDCGPGQDRAVIDPFDVVHNCEVVQVGSSSGSGP